MSSTSGPCGAGGAGGDGGQAPDLAGVGPVVARARGDLQRWLAARPVLAQVAVALGISGHGRGQSITLVLRRREDGDVAAAAGLPRRLHGVRVQLMFLEDLLPTRDHGLPGASTDGHAVPRRPDLSIGHPQGGAGTIGAYARRAGAVDLFVLSCGHVLAPPFAAEQGQAVQRPSVRDGGVEGQDDFGLLAHIADGFGAYLSATEAMDATAVDAALAQVLDRHCADLWPLLRPIRVEAPRRFAKVWKTGRTTGTTAGKVWFIGQSLAYDYGKLFLGHWRLAVVKAGRRPFSAGGDSGSLVVDRKRRAAVAMVVGADDKMALVVPLDDVRDQLSITEVLLPKTLLPNRKRRTTLAIRVSTVDRARRRDLRGKSGTRGRR